MSNKSLHKRPRHSSNEERRNSRSPSTKAGRRGGRKELPIPPPRKGETKTFSMLSKVRNLFHLFVTPLPPASLQDLITSVNSDGVSSVSSCNVDTVACCSLLIYCPKQRTNMPGQACHQLLPKAFQMLKRFGYWPIL